jgi:cell division protein FtsW
MVNIGVAISALPPTGLTLPFISYGGSSLFINAINMGLILNLSSRRKVVA